jgi:2-aminoadipate transaminase
MNFDEVFSSRIQSVKPSFIREILKAADNPDVFSFAGGLPDKELFPLFDEASSRGVVFVPGQSFYTDNKTSNCMRLNFSSSNPDQLGIGIERACRTFKDFSQI